MAAPFSQTIADAIKTALRAIGLSDDDNTAVNWAEHANPDSGPEGLRGACRVTRGSKKRSRAGSEGWIETSYFNIKVLFAPDVDAGAAPLDDQLDLLEIDVFRALAPLEDQLEVGGWDIDSAPVYATDEDPCVGQEFTVAASYIVTRLEGAFDGPGEE